MTEKLTLLDVHALIADARRPENSPRISDVIAQLEHISDRVSRSYIGRDDPREAFRAIWSCGLSEILTRDGNADNYSYCLLKRDAYGYMHIQDKTTYYCVLAELFREEGLPGKALSTLREIREELMTMPQDKYVKKDLFDVDQLICDIIEFP